MKLSKNKLKILWVMFFGNSLKVRMFLFIVFIFVGSFQICRFYLFVFNLTFICSIAQEYWRKNSLVCRKFHMYMNFLIACSCFCNKDLFIYSIPFKKKGKSIYCNFSQHFEILFLILCFTPLFQNKIHVNLFIFS